MAFARVYLYSKHVFSLLFDASPGSSSSRASGEAWQPDVISCIRLTRDIHVGQVNGQPRMVAVRDAGLALTRIAHANALCCVVPNLTATLMHCAHMLNNMIADRSARATQALLDGATAARVVYRYWLGTQPYVAYFDLPGDIFYFPLDLALQDVLADASRNDVDYSEDEDRACAATTSTMTTAAASASNAASGGVKKNEKMIGAEVCQMMDFVSLADTIISATLTVGPFELAMTEEVRQLAGPRGDFHGKKWSASGVDMTVAVDLLAARECALPVWSMIYKKGAIMTIQTGDGECLELRDPDSMHATWKKQIDDDGNDDDL